MSEQQRLSAGQRCSDQRAALHLLRGNLMHTNSQVISAGVTISFAPSSWPVEAPSSVTVDGTVRVTNLSNSLISFLLPSLTLRLTLLASICQLAPRSCCSRAHQRAWAKAARSFWTAQTPAVCRRTCHGRRWELSWNSLPLAAAPPVACGPFQARRLEGATKRWKEIGQGHHQSFY